MHVKIKLFLEIGIAIVLVFYLYKTNYLKFGSIKPHKYIHFYRSGIWTWCDWVLCSGSHRAEIMVSAGTVLLTWAQSLLPGSHGCW